MHVGELLDRLELDDDAFGNKEIEDMAADLRSPVEHWNMDLPLKRNLELLQLVLETR